MSAAESSLRPLPWREKMEDMGGEWGIDKAVILEIDACVLSADLM